MESRWKAQQKERVKENTKHALLLLLDFLVGLLVGGVVWYFLL